MLLCVVVGVCGLLLCVVVCGCVWVCGGVWGVVWGGVGLGGVVCVRRRGGGGWGRGVGSEDKRGE